MRRILVCEVHGHNYPQYVRTEVCPRCAEPEKKEEQSVVDGIQPEAVKVEEITFPVDDLASQKRRSIPPQKKSDKI